MEGELKLARGFRPASSALHQVVALALIWPRHTSARWQTTESYGPSHSLADEDSFNVFSRKGNLVIPLSFGMPHAVC